MMRIRLKTKSSLPDLRVWYNVEPPASDATIAWLLRTIAQTFNLPLDGLTLTLDGFGFLLHETVNSMIRENDLLELSWFGSTVGSPVVNYDKCSAVDAVQQQQQQTPVIQNRGCIAGGYSAAAAELCNCQEEEPVTRSHDVKRRKLVRKHVPVGDEQEKTRIDVSDAASVSSERRRLVRDNSEPFSISDQLCITEQAHKRRASSSIDYRHSAVAENDLQRDKKADKQSKTLSSSPPPAANGNVLASVQVKSTKEEKQSLFVPPGAGKRSTKLRNLRKRRKSRIENENERREFIKNYSASLKRAASSQSLSCPPITTQEHEKSINNPVDSFQLDSSLSAKSESFPASTLFTASSTSSPTSSTSTSLSLSSSSDDESVVSHSKAEKKLSASIRGLTAEQNSQSLTVESRAKQKASQLDVNAAKRMVKAGLAGNKPYSYDLDRELTRAKKSTAALEWQNKSRDVQQRSSSDRSSDWKSRILIKAIECEDESCLGDIVPPPIPYREPVHAQDESQSAISSNQAPSADTILSPDTDLPKVEEVSTLKRLTAPPPKGSVMIFKHLTLDDHYMPHISEFKTAKVLSRSTDKDDNFFLRLQLAERDRWKRKIDPETGDPILRRYEGVNDSTTQEETDGILEQEWSQLIEPRLVCKP